MSNVNFANNYPNRSVSADLQASGLVEAWKIPISEASEGSADVYTNPTIDGDTVYLATQAQYDANGAPVAGAGGRLMAIDKATGAVKWAKRMSDYSFVPGDFCRSAPLVLNDCLFFSSGISQPQSVAPYESTLIELFTGRPVTGTGIPPRLFCANKADGSLLWSVALAPFANTINDPGNWVYITQSPTAIVSEQWANPLIAIGTSSGQSFQPWFYTNGQPFVGLSLGNQLDFQMTDVGTLYLIDSSDGTVVATTSMGPELLQAGQVAPPEAFPPDESSAQVRHIVSADDLSPGGALNPIQANYAITCSVGWVLNTGGTVPSPLNGVSVVGTDNVTVTLEAGAVINATLNNVVVAVGGTFELGTTNVVIDGITYSTVADSTGLAGQTGLVPARISKMVSVGDTLTAEDAYQLNYYGASIWGNTIAYVPSMNAVVLTTGQPHAFTYQESVNLNPPELPTFLQSQNNIGEAQQQYINDPTPDNYNLMQATYDAYLSSIYARFELPRSDRLQRFRFCSVVMVSVDPETVGEITWTYASSAYDFWTFGFTNLFSRSQSNPGGWSDSQLYFERFVGPDADYGQGVYFTDDNVYMVACSKNGVFSAFDLSYDEPLLQYQSLIGNAVVNGASNYGSTVSGYTFATIGTQAYYPNDVNLGAPSPQNFPPQLRWYVNADTYFEPRQSYVFAYSITSAEPLQWVRAVIPDEQSPYGCTLAQVSSDSQWVYVPTCSGQVSILSLADGSTGGELALDGTGGQSAPMLTASGEMYAVLGRAGLGSFFNQGVANYAPAKHLYRYLSGNVFVALTLVSNGDVSQERLVNIQVSMTASFMAANQISTSRPVRLWLQASNDSNATFQNFRGGPWTGDGDSLRVSGPVASKWFDTLLTQGGKLQIGLARTSYPRMPQYVFLSVQLRTLVAGTQTIVLVP